jgi:hypothetical protein
MRDETISEIGRSTIPRTAHRPGDTLNYLRFSPWIAVANPYPTREDASTACLATYPGNSDDSSRSVAIRAQLRTVSERSKSNQSDAVGPEAVRCSISIRKAASRPGLASRTAFSEFPPEERGAEAERLVAQGSDRDRRAKNHRRAAAGRFARNATASSNATTLSMPWG